MAYDLILTDASGAAPTSAVLRDYFQDRDLYSAETDDDGILNILYENEDTGVYFTLHCADECLLRLNFIRPHIFAVETAIEVDQFVEDLGLETQGPDDKKPVPFDFDAFVASWVSHNEAAVSALYLEEPEVFDELVVLPPAEVRALWDWNYGEHDDAVEPILDGLHDPSLSPVGVFQLDGQTHRLMTWPIHCSTLIPDIASGVVMAGADDDFRFVGRRALSAFLPEHGTRTVDPAGYAIAVAQKSDAAIQALFAAAKSLDEMEVVVINTDHVLDADLPERQETDQ